MYNSRVKNRKTKRLFLKIFKITQFKTTNFCLAKKIILISIILWYISLFLNWIKIWNINNISLMNWFNKITVFNSISIFIALTLNLFILFSLNKKEKIKFLINIQIKDSNILIILNLIIILLSISSLYTIIGLKIFYLNIDYWKWIIFTIISWIIWISASIALKNKNANHKIILDESDNESKIQNNNNMKLPI